MDTLRIPLAHILESVQAEIRKCILGISNCHSNISTLIRLLWPLVKARILVQKLTLLAKLLEKDDGLSSRVFQSLVSDDAFDFSLIQQCRSLEQIGTSYLQLCLQNKNDGFSIVLNAKEDILAGSALYRTADHTPPLP